MVAFPATLPEVFVQCLDASLRGFSGSSGFLEQLPRLPSTTWRAGLSPLFTSMFFHVLPGHHVAIRLNQEAG